MTKSISIAFIIFIASSFSHASANLTPEESVGLNSILRQVSQMDAFTDDEVIFAFLENPNPIKGFSLNTKLLHYSCEDTKGHSICNITIEVITPMLKGATLRQARLYTVQVYRGNIVSASSERVSLK